MVRYLAARVAWALVLLFSISVAVFVLFFIAPRSPERVVCGGEQARRDCILNARAYLGLDKPVPVQYAKFMWRLVGEQSLGRSFITQREVNLIVAKAAPVTAAIVAGGMLLALALGLFSGILSALRPRSLFDRAMLTLLLVAISAPSVWTGLILSYFAGYKWGLTPISGYCDFFDPAEGMCGGAAAWTHHLVLPWITFAITTAAIYGRMIRASMLETLGEDYVRTARAKGAPPGRVMGRHVLRNALLPMVTILGLDLGLALGGSAFIETVFGLPGLGRVSLQALNQYDLPTIEGVLLFACLAIVVFNLVVDLLYAVVDPRITRPA